MCDVHLVCTYVHNYVKVLKIYFEYIQIKELIKKKSNQCTVNDMSIVLLQHKKIAMRDLYFSWFA